MRKSIDNDKSRAIQNHQRRVFHLHLIIFDQYGVQ